MIEATHPEAGYFRKYIYKYGDEEVNKNLDIVIDRQCSSPSPNGFNCETCYTDELYDMLMTNSTFIKLKKFISYQLNLYENPGNWVVDLKRWIKHSNEEFSPGEIELINDVLDDILEKESKSPDINKITNITNNFNGGNQVVNQGGVNTIKIDFTNILSEMVSNGVPEELVNEGNELLKDADKSDSLKRIAGNWIKNLPFKILEKSTEWGVKNLDKIQYYQDSLFHWYNGLGS